MDVREEPDGSLLLTYDSSPGRSGWSAPPSSDAGHGRLRLFIGTRGDDRLIGLLAGAATLALIAVVMLEQCRFRFDPMTR